MATTKQVALITGAYKGIGLEIGRQLGQLGIIVLLGARSLSKAEAAATLLREEQIEAHGIELDITNPDHIQAAVRRLETEFGKLDILINNAGVYTDHLGTPVEAVRASFEVNLFGPLALTDALLPLLKASPAGRIVNQSSILGSLGTLLTNPMYGVRSVPAYTSSKAALNAWTVQLSIALRDTTIKVNACHPGWVKTDMGGADAPMEIHEGAESAVWLATLPQDGPTGGFFHKRELLPW
ncbi:NAD(P)-dependent dehydrogenase (short-subunit alcohol dehydrogenase family) [Paenibacillus phyllosphaerae]|uniref:NAD(P)-dependent dehydrogenase (Short-subunit alcohol dehydrogenase family) n=1 Tax=Paenibacillus phyllosphaerae TaxID=274593 RepID=A0A7W5FQQ9_9BACL|nr:SDR family oxidoreductase [Paenibacillus phyllosphaerae]MBB3113725.1 NAD(P)-dependent dehydrogenase (short-subunit alcohol dehydrogenase family) [Paenibacillus phyllosphaerae]